MRGDALPPHWGERVGSKDLGRTGGGCSIPDSLEAEGGARQGRFTTGLSSLALVPFAEGGVKGRIVAGGVGCGKVWIRHGATVPLLRTSTGATAPLYKDAGWNSWSAM